MDILSLVPVFYPNLPELHLFFLSLSTLKYIYFFPEEKGVYRIVSPISPRIKTDNTSIL